MMKVLDKDSAINNATANEQNEKLIEWSSEERLLLWIYLDKINHTYIVIKKYSESVNKIQNIQLIMNI